MNILLICLEVNPYTYNCNLQGKYITGYVIRHVLKFLCIGFFFQNLSRINHIEYEASFSDAKGTIRVTPPPSVFPLEQNFRNLSKYRGAAR